MSESPTVLGIAEAREQLPELVRRFRDDPDAEPVALGPHRRPTAYLVGAASMRPGTGPTLAQLRRLAPTIRTLAAAHRIDEVAVFGSVARGEETGASDVDLLVVPAPGASYFDLAGLAIDLEPVLGRKVDIVSRRALLSGTSDDRIIAEAVPL